MGGVRGGVQQRKKVVRVGFERCKTTHPGAQIAKRISPLVLENCERNEEMIKKKPRPQSSQFLSD